jgi:two-component system, OmpR family, KDP operon response regulator KdpE
VSESGHILIVEDELQLRRTIRSILVAQGFDAWAAQTGAEALNLIRSEKFDLVLLDINLPDMTGLRVCREIRAGSNVAIVILTVRDSEEDKLAAFNVGADDYVTKPFQAAELVARIRAHLRRHVATTGLASDVLRFDECVIDFPRRTITRQGERISLSPKQFQLLRYLVNNRGKALSHRGLLQAVWGADYGEETNLLHAFIANLRKKIERNPSAPRYILTTPWFGYRFTVPEENEGPHRSSE